MIKWLVGFAVISGTAAPADSVGLRGAIEISTMGERVRGASQQTELRYPGNAHIVRSPDGRSFAVVRRIPNLDSGTILHRLELFDERDVMQWLRSRGTRTLSPARVLFERRWSGPGAPFSKVTWINGGREIALIGPGRADAAHRQVHILSVGRGTLRQITRHSASVLDYQFSEDGQSLLIVAEEPEQERPTSQRSYALGAGHTLYNMLSHGVQGHFRDARSISPAYYRLDRRSGRMRPIQLDPSLTALPSLDGASISPNGRWVALPVGVRSMPREWGEYRAYRETVTAWGNPPVTSERDQRRRILGPDMAFGGRIPWVRRYALGDMLHLIMEPLIDSPISWSSAAHVEWTDDSSFVTIAGGYLPLESTEGELRRVRAEAPGSVRVNVATREWSEAPARTRSSIENSLPDRGLQLDWSQNGRERYSLTATDLESRLSARITNWNPELPRLPADRHLAVRWRDEWNREWSGQLLLPQHFRSGTRYPLVIETNVSEDFLLPDPAHAPSDLLADRGVVVLRPSCLGQQSPDIILRYERNPNIGQATSYSTCLEGAVDHLVSAGIADRQRVGIIGFSFTGNLVLHALAFSETTFSAAIIVDSVQSTPWNYAMTFGFSPGMISWDAIRGEGTVPPFIGAPPLGAGLQSWLNRSPYFNADRIRTPILWEYHGPGPVGAWDIFTLMKRAHYPVELVHYPNGAHSLENPLEIADSVASNIDWLLFWLAGQASEDPGKADQFARWRELREQRDRLAAVPRPMFREWSSRPRSGSVR